MVTSPPLRSNRPLKASVGRFTPPQSKFVPLPSPPFTILPFHSVTSSQRTPPFFRLTPSSSDRGVIRPSSEGHYSVVVSRAPLTTPITPSVEEFSNDCNYSVDSLNIRIRYKIANMGKSNICGTRR